MRKGWVLLIDYYEFGNWVFNNPIKGIIILVTFAVLIASFFIKIHIEEKKAKRQYKNSKEE